MADNNNQANYQEVLEVRVDPKPFEKGLADLEKLYAAFLERLGGNAEGLLGAGIVGSMKDAQKATSDFGLDFAQILQRLGESLDQFADKFSTKLDASLGKAVKNAKKGAQEAGDALSNLDSNAPKPADQRAADVKDAERTIRRKTRTPAAESEPDPNSLSERMKQGPEERAQRRYDTAFDAAHRDDNKIFTTAQKVADQWNGIIQEVFSLSDAMDRRGQATYDRLQRWGAQEAQKGRAENAPPSEEDWAKADKHRSDVMKQVQYAQAKINREVEDERIKTYEKSIADQEAADRHRLEVNRQVQIGQQQDLAAQADRHREAVNNQVKLARQEAESGSLSSRMKQSPDESAQRRIDSLHQQALEAQARLQKAFNSEVEKTYTLEDQLESRHFGSDLAGRLEFLKQRLAEARDEMESLGKAAPGHGAEPSKANVAAQNEYNTALRTTINLEKQVESVTKQLAKENESLGSRILKSLGESFKDAFSMALKFTVAYRAVALVMDAVFAAVKAPFEMLKSGVAFLSELEDKTTDLTQVIAANVEYSKNASDNFVISQKIAGEAMQMLMDKAIEARVPVEALEKTFKALLEAKAIGLVGNMNQLITLAANMQNIITHVSAKGVFGVGQFETAIASLFNGHPQADNLLLRTIGYTPVQWQAMVDHAKTYHDLLTQLAPALEPYLDATGKAQLNMGVLKEQLDLIWHRIEAMGATGLFAEMVKWVKELNQWLESNSDTIERTIGKVGALVASFVNLGATVFRLFESFKGFELTASLVRSIAFYLLTAFTVLDEALDRCALGAKEVWAALHGDGDQMSRLEGEFNGRQQKRWQTWKDVAFDHDKPKAADKGGPNLNTKADPKGAPLDIPDDTQKNAEAAFRKAKADYDQQFQALDEVADKSRKDLRDMAQEGVIAHMSASRKIGEITIEELHKFDKLAATLLAKANAARAAIAGDPNKAPLDKKAAIETMDAQITELHKHLADQRKKLYESDRNEEKAAIEEMKQLWKEGEVEQPARLAEQLIEARRQAVEQAAKEERISPVQRFDAQAQLDAESHAAKMRRLNEEVRINETADGSETVAHLKAVGERQLADDQYHSHVRQLAREREELIRQEALRDERQADDARAAKLASLEQQAELHQSLSANPNIFSSEQAGVLAARRAELDLLTREAEAHYALALAKNAESDETRKLGLDLERLHQDRLGLLQSEIEQRSRGASAGGKRAIAESVLGSDTARLRADRSATKSLLSDAMQAAQEGGPLVSKELQEQINLLNHHLSDLSSAIGENTDAMNAAKSGWQDAVDGFESAFLGSEFKEEWGDNKTQAIGDAAGHAIAAVGQEKQIFQRGQQNGGTAGGIGAVLSEGPLSDALSKIPIAGAFVKPVGEMLTMLSDAFRSGARKIATQVKEQFEETTRDIGSGVLGTASGIRAVQAEMDTAISTLTAKAHEGMGAGQRIVQNGLGGPILGNLFNWFGNGAMDELAKLLPPMVDKMEEMLRTQQQVFQEFANQLKSMQLQSDTLSQINSQWLSINQEVAKYLDAGGDQQQASLMLQQGLETIQRQIGAELVQGYDQAVQDAIQLNNLAQQRYQAELQFKAQEFNLVNGDSVERMQAGAVTRGQQLRQLREQYQQQMDQMNAQISLESKKVAAERQVFDIAQSISDLHRQDETLQLASLELQLQKYKDLQNATTAIGGGAATPGKGDSNLAAQLTSIDQQVTAAATKLQTDVAQNHQGASGQDTKALQALLAQQQQLEAALKASAGGTLVGTGVESTNLGAVEAAQAAINQQASFAAKHPDTDTGGWSNNLGAYINMLTALGAQLSTQQQSMLNSSTQIGTSSSSFNASQLSFGALQSMLNAGLGANNTINITLNVPAGSDAGSIASTVSDALSAELARQSRQAIS